MRKRESPRGGDGGRSCGLKSAPPQAVGEGVGSAGGGLDSVGGGAPALLW